MEEFADWIKSVFESILEWLLELAGQVLTWILDSMLWVLSKVWGLILQALAQVLESIPVPGFMLNASGFWGNIPGTMVYFFQFFAVAEGMAMIGAALALRFLLRRIPLIG